MSSSTSERPQQNDEKIQKLLKEAGLDENSPIDPSSRFALQELLMNAPEQQQAEGDNLQMPKQKDPLQQQQDLSFPPPIDQVSTSNKVLQHCVSELSGVEALLSGQPLSSSVASTAGSAADESKEDRILRQLEQQTAMIIELHRRMDELTTLVARPSHTDDLGQNQRLTAAQQERLPELRDGVAREIPPDMPAQQQEPRGIMEHPGMNWARERLARLFKICQVFLALRRRQAPNLEGGLMLKLVIMLAILLSRFGSRRRRSKEEEWVWNYRFYFLVTLVIGGFLLQSGFIKFIYVFFVKENYPRRIWNGEEINVEQVAGPPERPRHVPPRANGQQQAQAENPGARRDWRHTLLGGGIAPNNPNEEQAFGPLRIILDVGLFVASFFLSIFPMWRPEAIPAAPPQQQEEQDEADDGVGLPEVRPPRNPFEAEDDDEGGE